MASAPLYRPPTAVVSIDIPYLSLVTKADPYWATGKYRELYDVYGGRRAVFYNPYFSGAYSRLSNDYSVGQQYGGPDPLIIDNLEPTVGNDVPGLYEGIDDGMGWA